MCSPRIIFVDWADLPSVWRRKGEIAIHSKWHLDITQAELPGIISLFPYILDYSWSISFYLYCLLCARLVCFVCWWFLYIIRKLCNSFQVFFYQALNNLFSWMYFKMLVMAKLPKLATEICVCDSTEFFHSQVRNKIVKFLCQISHCFFSRDRQ